MHLERPGVILVGILEFDANGDVPRLKEARLKSRNRMKRFSLSLSRSNSKSRKVERGAEGLKERVAGFASQFSNSGLE